MKEYTYNDLIAMQEQAKQRVMEMQKKSKYAVDDMNKSFGENSENAEDSEKPKTFSAHTVPVAQQPRNIQYPTGLVNSENEKNKNVYEKNTQDKNSKKDNDVNAKKIQGKNDVVSKFFNVFGKLNRDESEKMLILALCILLSNEQADDNLIMALLYLIA